MHCLNSPSALEAADNIQLGKAVYQREQDTAEDRHRQPQQTTHASPTNSPHVNIFRGVTEAHSCQVIVNTSGGNMITQ